MSAAASPIGRLGRQVSFDLLIFRRPRAATEDVVNPAPLEQDDDTAEESARTEEDVSHAAQNDDAQTSAEDVLEDDDQLEDNQPRRP